MPTVAGVIAMDATCGVTVSDEVPLIPPMAAVITLEPVATAVARPLELMVATDVVAEVQVTVELTFPVEPSLYLAVALNCWVAPIATLGLAGDTVMELKEGATVSVALPLIPLTVAVTLVEPAATACASPLVLTVATDWVVAAQVADEVTFAVEPSL